MGLPFSAGFLNGIASSAGGEGYVTQSENDFDCGSTSQSLSGIILFFCNAFAASTGLKPIARRPRFAVQAFPVLGQAAATAEPSRWSVRRPSVSAER
jgi:hypothetical protein